MAQWGGQVLVTLHTQGGASRRFVATVPSSAVQFSTTTCRSVDRELERGGAARRAIRRARAALAEVGAIGRRRRRISSSSPAPGAYFPGAALSGGEVVSGYVVPGLRADATGSICVSWRAASGTTARSSTTTTTGVCGAA